METVVGLVSAQVGPDEARRIARLILEQDQFQQPRVPRPLEGVVRRLGDLLEGPGERIMGWYETLADWLTETNPIVWTVLGAMILFVAVLLGSRVAGRRARRTSRRIIHTPTRSFDASGLEAEAQDAESKGDLETAVRLRFRAGLIRLHSAGVIQLTPSLTNGVLLTIVRSPTLGRLTRVFDEVVYGKRPALREDLTFAKAGWPRALDEARVP